MSLLDSKRIVQPLDSNLTSPVRSYLDTLMPGRRDLTMVMYPWTSKKHMSHWVKVHHMENMRHAEWSNSNMKR